MRVLGASAAVTLGLAVLLVPSAAAGAPHRPTLQQAVFDVIVEGSGTATHEVDGDGTNGLCQVSSHTHTSESYEYGRGKGLAVVFKRFRGIPHSPVFLTREGRGAARPTFNVRGSYEDFAEGQATREGPAACAPVTEAVGDEPEFPN